jgi:hypothetical protein
MAAFLLKCSSKSKTAGSDSSKTRFERKSNAGPDWFCVVFTGFEGGLCPLSNPKSTRQKVGFYFLTNT